ncbi:MAG: glutathione synthase [Pseudomonadota bacterium]
MSSIPVRLPLKLGVVMDPIIHVKPHKDSTLAMMRAAAKLDITLYYMEQDDLYLQDGKAHAFTQQIEVYEDDENFYTLGQQENIPLTDLDVILMRKDPPVDKRFIHCCYMLEQAARDGVRVMNNPTALLSLNEKIFASHFPQFCPPTVITSRLDVLRDFQNQHQKMILKPLDAMGGEGIFMIEPDSVNFDVIWETQTCRGKYPIIGQAFVPEISKGDKRIIIFNGKPFDMALVRLPKSGSIRGNLAAGGSYSVHPLTEREREISETVGKKLIDYGVSFAGLDVIGDKLIEINITSPTGLTELSKSCDIDLAGKFLELL